MSRCIAMTQRGTPCTRQAYDPYAICQIHLNQAERKEPERVPPPLFVRERPVPRKRPRTEILSYPQLLSRIKTPDTESYARSLEELEHLKDKLTTPNQGISPIGRFALDDDVNQYIQDIQLLFKGGNGSAARATLMDAGYVVLKSPLMVKDENGVWGIPQEQDRMDYEYVVQRALNDMRQWVPHFAMVFLWFGCRANVSARENHFAFCNKRGRQEQEYLLMEHVQPGIPWYQVIRQRVDHLEFLSIFLQVLMALEISQRRMQFTHYDLHAGNILLQHLPRDTAHGYTRSVFVYDVDGEKIYVPLYHDMYPVLIDFGRSHVLPLREDPQIRELQLQGEMQFTADDESMGQELGIEMREMRTWTDMVHLWRSVNHDGRKMQFLNDPELSHIMGRFAKGFEYGQGQSYSHLYPIAPQRQAPYLTPLALVRAILSTKTYRKLMECVLRRSARPQFYAWNHPQVRGALTPEEAQRWGFTPLPKL